MEIARGEGTRVGERCSESWLQVNLILDGSSSPLKYLVNRFRSSTYPRSLQTFDSLCFARGHSRLSAPRFHLSVLVPYVLSAVPPHLLPSLPSSISLSFSYSSLRIRSSRQNEGLLDAIGLVFKSIPIHSLRFKAARQIDPLKQSLPIRTGRLHIGGYFALAH